MSKSGSSKNKHTVLMLKELHLTPLYIYMIKEEEELGFSTFSLSSGKSISLKMLFIDAKSGTADSLVLAFFSSPTSTFGFLSRDTERYREMSQQWCLSPSRAFFRTFCLCGGLQISKLVQEESCLIDLWRLWFLAHLERSWPQLVIVMRGCGTAFGFFRMF